MAVSVVPIPMSTRESLIARIANPDDQAGWAEFTTIYGPLVYSELRRRGFNHDDSEDLTQRVFVGVVRGMRNFRYSQERGRFRDWLGTIVRNESVLAWRNQQRHPMIHQPGELLDLTPAPSPDPEWLDAFHAHMLATALERCQPRFEPATWSAFEQSWLQDKDAETVAAAHGREVEWVYVSKSRVLKALTEMIHEMTDDVPTFIRPQVLPIPSEYSGSI
ncbi:sigma-70 family RNA polymerase sigma factor [soil metagenome]